MFGLKIVKSKTYSDLKWNLNQMAEIIEEKDKLIQDGYATIAKKDAEIIKLQYELDQYKAETQKEDKSPELLVDTAETPLEVAKPKRQRKTVQKKEGSAPRKRVVHKTEE